MKKREILILSILVLFAVSGCAKDPLELVIYEKEYGFWSGLLHGVLTPISFIGSLLSEKYAVYAVNNTGGWYDFGFLLGVGGLGWGTSKKKSS